MFYKYNGTIKVVISIISFIEIFTKDYQMKTLGLVALAAIIAVNFMNLAYSAKNKPNSPAKSFIVSSIKQTKALIDLSDLLHNKYVFALRHPATGKINYTHSGEFMMNNGHFYQNGSILQGYPITHELLANACPLENIHFEMSLPAVATSHVNAKLNLNVTASLSQHPFNAQDSSTFNYVINTDIYDNTGKHYPCLLYFVKNENNKWAVFVVINNKMLTDNGLLSFDTSGDLLKMENLDAITFYPDGNQDKPQNISLSLAGSAQYAADFRVFNLNQDGRSDQEITSIDVDEIGYVHAYYSEGEIITAGKIAVMQATL